MLSEFTLCPNPPMSTIYIDLKPYHPIAREEHCYVDFKLCYPSQNKLIDIYIYIRLIVSNDGFPNFVPGTPRLREK